MRVCSFEGCNRKHLAKGLCEAHYQQQRAGTPLREIGSPRVKGVSKWAGMTCSGPACDREVYTSYLCINHYQQERKGEALAPIGMKKKPTGYAEEWECQWCKEVKNWKSMVLGLDSQYAKCRDCHREHMRQEKELIPGQKRPVRKEKSKEERWSDFLAELNG